MTFGSKQDYLFLRRTISVNKTIVWIDDSQNDMEQVAQEAFVEFWKAGIQNVTLFFGDYDGPVDKAVYTSDLRYIYDYMYNECINNDDEYSKKEYSELFSLHNCTNNTDKENLLVIQLPEDSKTQHERIYALIELWKKDPPSLNNWVSKKPLDAKYSVDCVFECLKDDDVLYALDVVLLEGDFKKLNCDTDSCTPVISIELYHYITQTLKKKCIVYSHFTYLNRLPNSWNYLYNQRYGDDVDIINREGLYSGSSNSKTINKVKDIFK